MKHVRLIGALMLAVPSLVLAQAQGRVKGIVSDTAGKPIAGAEVQGHLPGNHELRAGADRQRQG